MKKTEKEKYEKRIRELEQQVEDLRERESSADDRPPEGGETESSAGKLLETLGESFGLSGLIKSVADLPEFKDRLGEIDEELRRRLKDGDSPGTQQRRGMSGIPPGARGRRSGRKPAKSREETPPEPARKVDVFDEEDHLLVVCEIPGSDDKKIRVELNGDALSISAEALHRKGSAFQKELELPCVPEGKMTRNYRNGILRIKIMKAEG